MSGWSLSSWPGSIPVSIKYGIQDKLAVDTEAMPPVCEISFADPMYK
jgi:hypothetical protein